MIHYTCDRCKCVIDPETQPRYTVEIDVRLAIPAEPIAEDTEDLDPLAQLHDQLQRELSGEACDDIVDLTEDDIEPGDGCETYDLCQHCRDAFLANPLGREAVVGYGFSNN
ncbi:MAG: hypothetical protein AAF745_15935 [Planctomycetota bacterium]